MQTLDIYHGELVGAEVWSEAVCPQQQLLPHQLGVDVLGGLDHALQYSTVQYSTAAAHSGSHLAVYLCTRLLAPVFTENFMMIEVSINTLS